MIKLNGSSLALGATLAVGVMFVMGQAGPAQPQYVSWGPPKAGVVNIFNAPGSSVPAGGVSILFSVPPDRWLTITRASATGIGCACAGSVSCLRFAELSGSSVEEKGYAGYAPDFVTESPVGWVFRPGSQVVIVNRDTTPCAFSSYSLLGYQTRD